MNIGSGRYMKKTIIALAVLSCAAAAQAQSNVIVYGTVDASYVKQTNSSITMNPALASASPYAPYDQRSRIGFMGSEELGGGLKATFQLERRFTTASGASYGSTTDFYGAANVGLAGNFGQVRFGRVGELSTETYRVIDPFEQYGVGSMYTAWWRGDNRNDTIGYTARYDSPVFNGFKLGASYTVKNSTDVIRFWSVNSSPNNGWALSATYTNGPVYLVANYNKPADRLNGYNWNVGGAYAFGPVRVSLGYFGPVRVSLGYEKMEDIDSWPYSSQKNIIVGLSYTVGAGVIKASYNKGEGAGSASWGFDGDKWAIGYTHNLSKRTSAYVSYAHDKVEAMSHGGSPGSSSSVELGLTHKF
jgi:general bacterial porin, GBP family